MFLAGKYLSLSYLLIIIIFSSLLHSRSIHYKTVYLYVCIWKISKTCFLIHFSVLQISSIIATIVILNMDACIFYICLDIVHIKHNKILCLEYWVWWKGCLERKLCDKFHILLHKNVLCFSVAKSRWKISFFFCWFWI